MIKPSETGPERQSAVAIAYDSQRDDAPRVVAKGYGDIAQTIIRTAQENGLYVHESPELVGLLMQVDLDARIPPTLYLAIAELLAWLYSIDESTQGSFSASSSGPRVPDPQSR